MIFTFQIFDCNLTLSVCCIMYKIYIFFSFTLFAMSSSGVTLELLSEYQGSLSQLLYESDVELLNTYSDKIINTLGGINNILHIYIANKKQLLNKTQQDELSETLRLCKDKSRFVHKINNLSVETLQSSSVSIINPKYITSQEQYLEGFNIFLHTRK